MQIKYYDSILSEKEIIITDDFWKTTINHPHFSRLKNINQVGNLKHVFINSNQTRFSHSLGTGYLINTLLKDICEKSDKEKAVFAGLCHDLGHGPFSHSLEHFILPKLGIDTWKHEDLSSELSKEIYETIEDPSFDFSNFRDILEKGTTDGKNDIFQLISSKSTGYDCDRNDYLVRDAFMSHKPVELDFSKIHRGLEFRPEFNCKKYCQIIKHEAVKEIANFLNFRYKMFLEYYHYNDSFAIELMVADIFKEADKFSGFSKNIHDKGYFLSIDDSILQTFKKYHKKSDKLKKLHEDFESRNFYVFCDEIVLRSQFADKMSKKEKSEKMEQLVKEIEELFECGNSENPVVASFASIDSQKDVNFAEFLVENEDGHVGAVSESEELMKLFVRKQKFCVKVFAKRYENKEIVKNTVQKWKNRNQGLFE